MNRIMAEPMTNKYHDVLNELNHLCMAIKISQMDSSDPKIKEAQLRHPLPTNAELDRLHNKINEALRFFDKPMRVYR